MHSFGIYLYNVERLVTTPLFFFFFAAYLRPFLNKLANFTTISVTSQVKEIPNKRENSLISNVISIVRRVIPM